MIHHEEYEEESNSVSSSSNSSFNYTNYSAGSNLESSIINKNIDKIGNKNENDTDVSIQFSDDNDTYKDRLIVF